MASSSLPSTFATISPSSKPYTRQAFRVRAQSFREEADGSSSRVDANMGVLRERIEKVKMREKMDKFCRSNEDKYGWNYGGGYDYKARRDGSELFQLVGLVGATIGFTCLTGTLFLSFVSLLLHFHQ
ncbi:hypothetical protein F3Y22_tig00006449pilonHSYRG00021 [Hibiscus syriacus]|uniref:Uncharacterized protein n=2 Tax=Hibiscus syriacus TaxID=106335 RepID=A0A6A3CC10_HIBSY|nr:hypothetical protein F3Y22_tig00006449pilonHSYRG00021 [Hibiscus syriacus]